MEEPLTIDLTDAARPADMPQESEPAPTTTALAASAPQAAAVAQASAEPAPPLAPQTRAPAERPAPRHLVPAATPATLGRSRVAGGLLLAAGCALVAAAAAAGMALPQGDWASAASIGGRASLVVAAGYLLGTGVRALRGPRRRRALLLGLTIAVVFGALGAASLRAPMALHLAQAQAAESDQEWQGALTEYALAGARAPSSRDLARVYLEWGAALMQQGQYAPAVQSYFTVLYGFTGVPDMRQPAIDGLWQAYAAWLASSSSAPAYPAIIHDIHAGGQAAWCFGPCPASAALLEAQARFQYGQLLDRQQQYDLAIAFFESVAATDSHSSYVTGAHLAAAADYYAIAQLYVAGNTCSQALGSYLQLVTHYADTAQGAKAKAALAQPVQVSGAIAGDPTAPALTIYLSLHIEGTTSFSDEYSTGLDGKGHFTFSQVRPGHYNLSAAFADGSGRFWHNATTGDPYFVMAGPLCALDLGQLQW